MINIIILTAGDQLPLNVKNFSYLLEKNKKNFKIISQRKNVYLSNKYILKKKGKFFFLKLKLGAFIKMLHNLYYGNEKKNINNSKIYKFFGIKEEIIGKYPSSERILYVENLNQYLLQNKFNNTLFISFGAPIIKKKSINYIKNHGHNLILNSHIGTSNYPGITPHLWALYNKDYDNIGFILHELTDKIDKGKIYLEKKNVLKIVKNNIGQVNINQLTRFLLLYSSQQIHNYLSGITKIEDLKAIKNTYDSNIKTNFAPTYFETIIAERNLKKYFS